MSRIAVIWLLLLLMLPASAAAADGSPDLSFGTGGVFAFAPQQFTSPFGAAVDGQGRILVGATLEDGSRLHTRAAILRLLPDGSLDPAYGSGGIATISPPAPYLTMNPAAMALDAQGRVVVAGDVDDSTPAVFRVLPDGTLDAGFAAGGILVARGVYGDRAGIWESVALDGSSIVIGGAAFADPPPTGTGVGWTAEVVRIGDTGVPDPAFANGGFLELPLPGTSFSGPRALALDHSGRIVLGIWHRSGSSGNSSASVVRITPAGTLDAGFGGGGVVALGSMPSARTPSVSVTARDEIVVVGGWSPAPGRPVAMAARLLPSGKLDPAYGSGGQIATTGLGATGGVLDCQGDLLLSSDAGLTRFGPDGRLDPTFHLAALPPIPVGATAAIPGLAPSAFAPGGAMILIGSAADGPSDLYGGAPKSHLALAVARMQAACPIADSTPPAVRLLCTAKCRSVTGSALDDPLGRGIARVLLGVERIAGKHCTAWNGRGFAALPCARAATRLLAVPSQGGAFRIPALGAGRFVLRAVAVDRAGNRSRLVVRRFSR